jgi:hypothetical protein
MCELRHDRPNRAGCTVRDSALTRAKTVNFGCLNSFMRARLKPMFTNRSRWIIGSECPPNTSAQQEISPVSDAL